jgi:hypothetical protein
VRHGLDSSQGIRTWRSWSSQAVMEERQKMGKGQRQRSGLSAISTQGERTERDAKTWRVKLAIVVRDSRGRRCHQVIRPFLGCAKSGKAKGDEAAAQPRVMSISPRKAEHLPLLICTIRVYCHFNMTLLFCVDALELLIESYACSSLQSPGPELIGGKSSATFLASTP